MIREQGFRCSLLPCYLQAASLFIPLREAAAQNIMVTGAIFGTRYRSRDTGARTGEIRGNLYIQGDLDVHGEITQNGEPLETGGSSLPYKIYVALLTQSGTDAPVATVMENTLGGTVVWTYTGIPGRYNATLNDAFPIGKTVVLITPNTLIMPTLFGYVFGVGSSVQLRVFNEGFEGADDRLNNASIEIRVYP